MLELTQTQALGTHQDLGSIAATATVKSHDRHALTINEVQADNHKFVETKYDHNLGNNTAPPFLNVDGPDTAPNILSEYRPHMQE